MSLSKVTCLKYSLFNNIDYFISLFRLRRNNRIILTRNTSFLNQLINSINLTIIFSKTINY